MNMTPDQQKQVAIRLGYEDMRFHNGQWWGCRLGIYEIRIGSNWDLLGACLNRAAEMSWEPSLWKFSGMEGWGIAMSARGSGGAVRMRDEGATPLEAAIAAFVQLPASQGDA